MVMAIGIPLLLSALGAPAPGDDEGAREAERDVERLIAARRRAWNAWSKRRIDDDLSRSIHGLLWARARRDAKDEETAHAVLSEVCRKFLSRLDKAEPVERPIRYLSRALSNELKDAAEDDSRDLRAYVRHLLAADNVARDLPMWEALIGERKTTVIGRPAHRDQPTRATPTRLDLLERPESFLYHPQGLEGEPIRERRGEALVPAIARLIDLAETAMPLSEVVRILKASCTFGAVKVEMPKVEPGTGRARDRRESPHLQAAILSLRERKRAYVLIDLDAGMHEIVLALPGIDPYLDEAGRQVRRDAPGVEEFLEWWLEAQFGKAACLDELQQFYGGRTCMNGEVVARYFDTKVDVVRVKLSQAKKQVQEEVMRRVREDDDFLGGR